MKKGRKAVTPQKVTPKKDAVALVEPAHQTQINGLLTLAIEKKVPVETLKELLEMSNQIKKQAAQEAFVKAMANFQKECPTIIKTKIVKDKSGNKRYSYAPIESIVQQVKTPLANNGLSYSLNVENDKDMMVVLCTIKHELGHSETTRFPVPIGKEEYMSDVQKYGARSTFAKRYAFMNALGIMTGDEDTDATPDTSETPPDKQTPSKSQPAKPPTNFVEQLKARLWQMGAMTEKEAIVLLKEIWTESGKSWANYTQFSQIPQETAKVMLAQVIIRANKNKPDEE